MFDGIEWTELANRDMPLGAMIDKLYEGRLATLFTEKLRPPTLREVYDKHQSPLEALTKKIIPDGYLTPAKITEPGSNEDFLFMIIGAVQYIEWALVVQDGRGAKWHTEEIARLDECTRHLQRYSDEQITIDFPNLPADTIDNLRNKLKNTRMEFATNNIISIIKDYFGIERVKKSNRQKQTESIDKMIKTLT